MVKYLPIAAVIGKENKDVSREIAEVLAAMSYNKMIFTVATDNEFAITENVRSLGLEETQMAIGHSGSFRDDVRFFAKSSGRNDELALALDGYLLDSVRPPRSEGQPDCELIGELIGERMEVSRDLFEAVRLILPVLHGAFSFIVMGGRRAVVARDVFGFEPLFWGEDERCVAFASERKALWSIGLRDAAYFPSGCIAAVSGEAKNVFRVLSLVRPPVVNLSLDVAAQRLVETLNEAFQDFRRVKEVGLLFSGGVDSSVVARISRDAGLKSTLYGAAIEGARDAEVIERSAFELGCKVRLRIISMDEVEEYLCKTLLAVEEASLMKAVIGLPVYAATELAASEGVGRVFSGQGADELFGGYARYRRIVGEGCERLYDAMWDDVAHIGEASLQRDSAIASANNVDLCLPFLHLDVVNFAVSLPVGLKVKGAEDVLRKHVLREAAKLLGLPESIAYMPKKAVQYSSGSDIAIRKLAKRKGKSPSEYVEGVFKEVFREYFPKTR